MPQKFVKHIPISDEAWVGTREYKGGNKYWHLRFYSKTAKQYFWTDLDLAYEEGFASRKEAEKRGMREYRKMLANAKAGIQPSLKLTPDYIRRAYIADIKERCAKNEKLIKQGKQPSFRVEGGRGYWTERRTKEAVSQLSGVIKKFFDEALPKELARVRQKDLNRFRDWVKDTEYGKGPGTINKALVQIRMIWRYAESRDWVSFIPQLEQEPQDLENRTRRKLTPEEYSAIIEESRDRYEVLLDRGISSGYHFDLYYQFHFWILIMSNSGIRPPGGGEKRLLLKWSDIQYEEREDGTTRRFLLRKSEKAHLNYEAVILPNAYLYLDELKAFQEGRELKTEYIFAHTTDKPPFWKKGDPIKSFKKQWESVVKACNLDVPVGTPQSGRLTPYSCRAWFITNRAMSSDTLRFEDLAKATGTSVEVISKIYYDFNTRKVFGPLTAGSNAREDLKPIYKLGHYVGRA